MEKKVRAQPPKPAIHPAFLDDGQTIELEVLEAPLASNDDQEAGKVTRRFRVNTVVALTFVLVILTVVLVMMTGALLFRKG